MIYYANPCTDSVRAAMSDGMLGCITTPSQGNLVDPVWEAIADNGCFSRDWDANKWREWLPSVPRSVRFAVVPDVVGDHAGTLTRWAQYAPHVQGLGFTAAFVCQDGCQPADIPADADAVFIGGSTSWKLSAQSFECVQEARRRGVWAHMGRVNSFRRLQTAHRWGCDSVDGTYLTFGPDVNLPKLLSWLRAIEAEPEPLWQAA